MDKKKTSSTNDQQQFSEHLDKATAIVRSWPAWKQGVLGVPTADEPNTKKNAEPSDVKEEKWFAVFIVGMLVTFVAATTFSVIEDRKFVMSSTGVEVRQFHHHIYEEGAHARRNGVPANANPYAVAHCSSEAATWLNGWIDAKE